jgi:CHAD domain-containing protein
MREHARRQAALLLRHVSQQVERVAATGEPDSIHDLRVSIRRFRACLRVFRAFYPRRARKRIGARLAPLMKAAGGVRDRDIAVELLAQAGLAPGSPTMKRLAAEREASVAGLRQRARALQNRDFVRRWEKSLEL